MPKKEKPLNMRKALAGLQLLEGKSQKAALTAAGYSPCTARRPKQQGLSAKECLDEVQKLDPAVSPAKLISKARRLLGRKLDHLNNDNEALESAKASEIARIIDVTEKHHGSAGSDGSIDPRQWAERTDWMMQALQELKARQAQPLDDVVVTNLEE